ncbi:MAG: hypothetical protein FJ144_27095 [Deltaproteobacteria bacterium]|nr:hypothetical protein [Deltaproteobacteria bacterium]
MPNIYVMGLDREEARAFSRLATDFFERELGTPREHVYVYRQEVTLFRDGVESAMPMILRLSWVRRPPDHFPRAARGLTRIVREDLGRTNPVQVELHEKWDDAMVDGELCSAWAAKNR